ncbi:hypothetical protein LEP1GSC109_1811 [Leptospira interrogans str. UI 13372]|nr:hypothetical protein LEP1GSC110_2965 [Leptospira interrogans serovar Medanensis str. UT053]EMN97906.1 hypothetical protein LEP1GSC112_1249 [Leptospira interrogans serovar Pomona str. UT364]EMO93833.1 hypothetical protein LEP1GSC109_1811 [Leptospira interrogans str. UI 13372]
MASRIRPVFLRPAHVKIEVYNCRIQVWELPQNLGLYVK